MSGKLFEIDGYVRGLPGGARTRQFIVNTSLEHLRRLAADVGEDSDLALDVGTAYMRVARVQGIPISPNLGQMENAEQNLQIAERMIGQVLEAQPANRTAILRASQIAHDRMILAEYRRPDTAALPLAYQSEEWWNKYLGSGTVDDAELDQVLVVGINIANWYGRKDLDQRALGLLHRVMDLANARNQRLKIGQAQLVVARVLRSKGDLDGALQATHEAVRILQPPPGETRTIPHTNFALALVTEGEILGEENAISLGRTQRGR